MDARGLVAVNGICRFADVYSAEQLAGINRAVDAALSARSNESRSYFHVDEMAACGALEIVLSPRMLDLIFALMPDPVLYHLHINEIAARAHVSHIFGETMAGWHRDSDSLYVAGDPTHVSIFVYLTDVGPEDGPFELVPRDPRRWLSSGAPVTSVAGKAGATFAWHRSFYHRAAPNRGPVRRRLLKLSVQRNAYPSRHLQAAHFQAVARATPPGDPVMDLLLGRYQGKSPPELPQRAACAAMPFRPTGSVALSNSALFPPQIRGRARQMKRLLRGLVGAAEAAYD